MIHLKPERKIVFPMLVKEIIEPLASVFTDNLKNIKEINPVSKIPEAI
jgi:hypothetical protein